MLAKLVTLVKSKTAIAVLGVVLVGGSGGAVAMAATTGHLSTLGINLNMSDSQTKTPESTESPDSHGHTTSVVGLLTACNTTATPNTISVKDKAGKSWTFVITTGANGTRFNGDTETASTTKGDNSANAGGASTGDHTGGASTSAHAAPTLADICATANIGARNVEVQATANGSSYDAWKVTLQGPASANHDSNSSDSKGGSTSGDNSGSEGSQATPEPKDYEGTVTAVSANGFTLTHNGASFTVVVTATTHFSNGASLATLQVNAHVSVAGTVSGSTLTATYIEVSAPDATSTANH